MESIIIRYGETVTMPIDADDATAVTATLHIGNPGESPVLSKLANLTAGEGVIELEAIDTEIPLGEYSYQITVVDNEGHIAKYPSLENCEENSFPKFVVLEALDATEVVS